MQTFTKNFTIDYKNIFTAIIFFTMYTKKNIFLTKFLQYYFIFSSSHSFSTTGKVSLSFFFRNPIVFLSFFSEAVL